MKVRQLKAHEIELRAQTVKRGGCLLLLYKDARVDMNILDETYGVMNWQRKHSVINDNLYCEIGVYDAEKKEWVWKQDVGVESYSDKEKGQASDAFKRAGFNWGIGRELYTAPFTWINLNPNEFSESNGKFYLSNKLKFNVKHIAYNEDNAISELEIEDQDGNIRFTMSGYTPAPKTKAGEDDKKLQERAEREAAKMIRLTSIEEIKSLWNAHKDLHNVEVFKLACVNAQRNLG